MTKERLFRFFGEIAIIAGVVTAVCFPVTAASCRVSPEGITIIGGDYSSPKLLDFIVAGTDSLKFVFSDEIELDNLYVSPSAASSDEFARSKVSMTSVDLEKTDLENGVEYTLRMPEETECGIEYVVFAEAEDKRGNTLSFSTSFYGYNEMIPKLILSEVRTEASKPKPEFIELYCLTGGNTGGMVLEIAYNKSGSVKYTLPAADVSAGEYIVVHLRSYDDQKSLCVDETSERRVHCQQRCCRKGCVRVRRYERAHERMHGACVERERRKLKRYCISCYEPVQKKSREHDKLA